MTWQLRVTLGIIYNSCNILLSNDNGWWRKDLLYHRKMKIKESFHDCISCLISSYENTGLVNFLLFTSVILDGWMDGWWYWMMMQKNEDKEAALCNCIFCLIVIWKWIILPLAGGRSEEPGRNNQWKITKYQIRTIKCQMPNTKYRSASRA